MDAVKPGDWVSYEAGAALLGIAYGTFGSRARRAGLQSRVHDGALQVCLTAAFLKKYLPQPAPVEAVHDVSTALWLEGLAGEAGSMSEDLAREAGVMNADGDERAGSAGLSAAVVMGCLALLLRVGAEMLSAPQEDASDV